MLKCEQDKLQCTGINDLTLEVSLILAILTLISQVNFHIIINWPSLFSI